MALLPIGVALDLSIFAINTLLYPDASSPEDMDMLEAKAEDVIETLADIRTTLQEMTQ